MPVPLWLVPHPFNPPAPNHVPAHTLCWHLPPPPCPSAAASPTDPPLPLEQQFALALECAASTAPGQALPAVRHLATVFTQAGAGGAAPTALGPSASGIFLLLSHQMDRHMALAGAAWLRAAGCRRSCWRRRCWCCQRGRQRRPACGGSS